MLSTEERFWAKVDKNGPNGCWLWTASFNAGYGQFRMSNPRRLVKAHRFTWELLVGPIPPTLEPDHRCRVTQCVNPAHMELVTHVVNVMRGDSPHAINSRKTHCANGHPFDEANTYITSQGKRMCRRCHSIRQCRYQKRGP